jgi:hypothetical protein
MVREQKMSKLSDMIGGGGGSAADKVSYTQSPEQQQMYQSISPLIANIANSGMNNRPAWYTPGAPQSGGYKVQGYDVPSNQSLMPTSTWYGNISPEVKAGLNAPYDEARQQMFEQMGSQGQMGSASGGYSGAAAAALGKFEATRANNVGLQAWQMTQPGLQADYNARLAQNQYLSNQNNAASQWQAGTNQAVNMAQWQNLAEAYKFPYTGLPGLLGGTYSSPVVDQSPSAKNNIGSGIMGGMGGYGWGQQSGVGGGWGAGLGAFGSMMGGK